jgi:hypothetical protein
MKTKNFVNRLYEAAVSTDAYIRYYCGQGDYEIRYSGNFRILKKIVMPLGSSHPQSGLWQVQYEAVRCGEASIYNAAFLARRDKPPRMIMTRPGTTLVSPGLYGDMRPSLFAQATVGAGKESCHDIRIVDTALIDERQNIVVKGVVFSSVVQEVWTLDVCWQPVMLTVVFSEIEGKPGTSVAIKDPVKLPVTARIPGTIQKDGSRDGVVSLDEIAELRQRVEAFDLKGSVPITKIFDAMKALDTIKKKAAENLDDYQYLLATLYLEGKGAGIPKNINTAAYWALRAAYERNLRAINLVARIYETGAWMIKDEDEAKKWYRFAGNVERLGNLNAKKKTSKTKPKSKSFFDFLKSSSPPPANDDHDTSDRP